MQSVKEQIADIRHKLDLLESALSEDEMNATADEPPIADMLDWRGHRGDHFYNTIQHHLRTQLIGIGQYDMPIGIILALTDDVGLQILPDYNRYTSGPKVGQPVCDEHHFMHLSLRFVPLPKDNWIGEHEIPSPLDAWFAHGEDIAWDAPPGGAE